MAVDRVKDVGVPGVPGALPTPLADDEVGVPGAVELDDV
jgi:hypothetical protein